MPISLQQRRGTSQARGADVRKPSTGTAREPEINKSTVWIYCTYVPVLYFIHKQSRSFGKFGNPGLAFS